MSDIKTSHVYPPIPDRQFDWSAVHDDYDGAEDSSTRNHIGYGRTEAEAIADLKRLDDERAEWAMADACRNRTCSCRGLHCSMKPLPAPSFTLDPEHVPEELNQRDWYFGTWLPNARKALRGQPHDRALLEGETQQANDDQNWDSRSEGNWS